VGKYRHDSLARGANFQQYYDASWGRCKSKTKPVPGNHEYHLPGATG
jgi:hypothetical protein